MCDGKFYKLNGSARIIEVNKYEGMGKKCRTRAYLRDRRSVECGRES
jgi:hypothetical protein